MQSQYAPEQWVVASEAWDGFVEAHPELGLSPGRQAMHNFFRIHRPAMVAADAIRKCTHGARHWIAEPHRFKRTAFDLLTSPALPSWLSGREEGAA